GLIASNPITKLTLLRHDNPKDGRPLSAAEVTRLLETSKPRWRDVWYALLTTGMRIGELIRLRFSDVDWGSREIIVRKHSAKNHIERRIPLDGHLYAILERLEAGRLERQPGRGNSPKDTERIRERFSRERVFVTGQNTPLSAVDVYHTFMRCLEVAGIP